MIFDLMRRLKTSAVHEPQKPNAPALVVGFFDYVYSQGELLTVLDCITQKRDYIYNEEGCWFPDPTDPDPFCHFEGVKFGLVDESEIVVISEAECWHCVRQVAEAYVLKHGDKGSAVAQLLERI